MSEDLFISQLQELANVYEQEMTNHRVEVAHLRDRIKELERNEPVECRGWQPCDSEHTPMDGERVVVRNYAGGEMMETFFPELMPLFIKYKEWASLPE